MPRTSHSSQSAEIKEEVSTIKETTETNEKRSYRTSSESAAVIDIGNLQSKKIAELVATAKSLGITNFSNLRKQELIIKIVEAQTKPQAPDQPQIEGIIMSGGTLEVLPDGYGFLRSASYNYLPSPDDIYVSPSQIKKFLLRTGDTIYGQVRPPKEAERFYALLKVEDVNKTDPEYLRERTIFDNLTPLYPNERMRLETAPSAVEMRIVDMLCPVGKGQRGLIVSPPKSVKQFYFNKLQIAYLKIIKKYILLFSS